MPQSGQRQRQAESASEDVAMKNAEDDAAASQEVGDAASPDGGEEASPGENSPPDAQETEENPDDEEGTFIIYLNNLCLSLIGEDTLGYCRQPQYPKAVQGDFMLGTAGVLPLPALPQGSPREQRKQDAERPFGYCRQRQYPSSAECEFTECSLGVPPLPAVTQGSLREQCKRVGVHHRGTAGNGSTPRLPKVNSPSAASGYCPCR